MHQEFGTAKLRPMSDGELRDADKLTFVLEHRGPIPLMDFTTALQRLSMRYGREARAVEGDAEPRLYIAEIRKGSVIVALVAIGTAVFATVGVANSLTTFAHNLKDVVDHFKTESPPAQPVTKADCDDMRALSLMVFNTYGGSLHVHFGDRRGKIVFKLTEAEARVADNRAAAERVALVQQEEHILSDVVLVWDQVRNAPGIEDGRSPDRGIIQTVDGRPRQVTFASDDLKDKMGWHGFNPFDKAFVVDVKVLVGPNGPLAYRVLALHDVLDRE
jgi:hypothetical protein